MLPYVSQPPLQLGEAVPHVLASRGTLVTFRPVKSHCLLPFLFPRGHMVQMAQQGIKMEVSALTSTDSRQVRSWGLSVEAASITFSSTLLEHMS